MWDRTLARISEDLGLLTPDEIHQQQLEFSNDLYTVIKASVDSTAFGSWSLFNPSGWWNEYYRISEIWAIVTWGVSRVSSSSTTPIPAYEIKGRLEQLLGTMEITANSIRQGNWEFKGFAKDAPFSPTGGNESDWWAAILITKTTLANNRPLALVARGDACTECVKYSDFETWITRAIDVISNYKYDSAFRDVLPLQSTDGRIKVITLAFTKPGAKVDGILARLQNNSRITGSSIPILASWVDTFGNILYKCISNGCTNLTSSEKLAIACNQHGEDSHCNAIEEGVLPPPPAGPEDQPLPLIIDTPPPLSPPVPCVSSCFI